MPLLFRKPCSDFQTRLWETLGAQLSCWSVIAPCRSSIVLENGTSATRYAFEVDGS